MEHYDQVRDGDRHYSEPFALTTKGKSIWQTVSASGEGLVNRKDRGTKYGLGSEDVKLEHQDQMRCYSQNQKL